MHTGNLPAKPEDLTGLFFEASWLNLPIFFSTFLQHEKVYYDNRFLVKVRSGGHFWFQLSL